MDEKKQKYFSELINEHIDKTKKDIENLKELVKPISPDNAIGRLSRMEALSERSVNQANLEKAKKRLKLLEQASERVKTLDYGYCKRCEEEISQKRLEILPESLICMTCINKKE